MNEVQLDIAFDYDVDMLQLKNKCCIIGNVQFSLGTSDPKLAKVLGCDVRGKYTAAAVNGASQSLGDVPTGTYTLLFPHRVFINVFRQLKVQCYQLSEYTLYEQKKQQFLLINQQQSWGPGDYLELTSNYQASFQTATLQ